LRLHAFHSTIRMQKAATLMMMDFFDLFQTTTTTVCVCVCYHN
jgi:hypothetical protein